MTEPLNARVAQRLEEVGRILEEQGANPHRVRSYRRAAETVRGLPRPLSDLLDEGDRARLEDLPGIGALLQYAGGAPHESDA